MSKNNFGKTISLEISAKNKLEYLESVFAKTDGMFLEIRPIKWSVINNCDSDGNVDKVLTKNKGPKI